MTLARAFFPPPPDPQELGGGRRRPWWRSRFDRSRMTTARALRFRQLATGRCAHCAQGRFRRRCDVEDGLAGALGRGSSASFSSASRGSVRRPARTRGSPAPGRAPSLDLCLLRPAAFLARRGRVFPGCRVGENQLVSTVSASAPGRPGLRIGESRPQAAQHMTIASTSRCCRERLPRPSPFDARYQPGDVDE